MTPLELTFDYPTTHTQMFGQEKAIPCILNVTQPTTHIQECFKPMLERAHTHTRGDLEIQHANPIHKHETPKTQAGKMNKKKLLTTSTMTSREPSPAFTTVEPNADTSTSGNDSQDAYLLMVVVFSKMRLVSFSGAGSPLSQLYLMPKSWRYQERTGTDPKKEKKGSIPHQQLP